MDTSYRSAELVEKGGLPFVNLKCIDRDGGFRTSGLKRYLGISKPEQLVSEGDIVIAVTDMTQDRRIVGQAARVPPLAGGSGVVSMDLVKVNPRGNHSKTFLYAALRFSAFSESMQRHANGANVLHLSPKSIAAYSMAWPTEALQRAFTVLVEDQLTLIARIASSSEALRQARDLLLPRLISGELSVEAPEHAMEAAE